MVHTRGRQFVCDFSGFSKMIPILEHPRVVCTLPTELRKIYRRVIKTARFEKRNWSFSERSLFLFLFL